MLWWDNPANGMETKVGWQKTYLWGNGFAEVDSKDNFACDDDAHKAYMCTQSHIMWWKTGIKDGNSEDTPCDETWK